MFCRACNYPLTGLQSRRCPECGTPFDPDQPRTWARRPIGLFKRRLLAATGLYAGLLYALLLAALAAVWWRPQYATLDERHWLPWAMTLGAPLALMLAHWAAAWLFDRHSLHGRLRPIRCAALPLVLLLLLHLLFVRRHEHPLHQAAWLLGLVPPASLHGSHSPKISSDGRHVVFVCGGNTFNALHSGAWHVVRYDVHAGTHEVISPFSENFSRGRFDTDATTDRIALCGWRDELAEPGRSQLYLHDRAAGLRFLSDDLAAVQPWSVCLSDDGSTLWYVVQEGFDYTLLRRVLADDSVERMEAIDHVGDLYDVSEGMPLGCSSDGQSIIIEGKYRSIWDDGRPQLWQMPLRCVPGPGGVATATRLLPDHLIGMDCFSRDMSRVVAVCTQGDEKFICTCDVAGRDIVRLPLVDRDSVRFSTGPGFSTSNAWGGTQTRDGRQLVCSLSLSSHLEAEFHSRAGVVITADDTKGSFIYLQTGNEEARIIGADGTDEPANDVCSSPGISDDGRWIVFASYATNLVAHDPNLGESDVFLHDTRTGRTTLISQPTDYGWPVRGTAWAVLLAPLAVWMFVRRHGVSLVAV